MSGTPSGWDSCLVSINLYWDRVGLTLAPWAPLQSLIHSFMHSWVFISNRPFVNQVRKFSFSHITYFDGFCSVIFYFHDWPAAVYTVFQPSSPLQQWAFDLWLLSKRYITSSRLGFLFCFGFFGVCVHACMHVFCCFLLLWFSGSFSFQMKLNKMDLCHFWICEIFSYICINIDINIDIGFRYISGFRHMYLCMCLYLQL